MNRRPLCPAAESVPTRVVIPETRATSTKTSDRPSVSPVTRSSAMLKKATGCQSSPIDGPPREPVARAPKESVRTRVPYRRATNPSQDIGPPVGAPLLGRRGRRERQRNAVTTTEVLLVLTSYFPCARGTGATRGHTGHHVPWQDALWTALESPGTELSAKLRKATTRPSARSMGLKDHRRSACRWSLLLTRTVRQHVYLDEDIGSAVGVRGNVLSAV